MDSNTPYDEEQAEPRPDLVALFDSIESESRPQNEEAEWEYKYVAPLRWKPKAEDLLAAANTPELRELVKLQISDDKRKFDPSSGTSFDVAPIRKGPRANRQYAFSLDKFEGDALEQERSGEPAKAGTSLGIPCGAVPVDIAGYPVSLAHVEERNVERIHERLTESPARAWQRILYEAAEELLLALSPTSRAAEQQHIGQFERVADWLAKWRRHPELTPEGRQEVIRRVVAAYEAAELADIREVVRQERAAGDSVRTIAKKLNLPPSTVSRWGGEKTKSENGGDKKMTAAMEEAIRRVVHEAAREGAQEGFEIALSRSQMQKLMPEIEEFLEEVRQP